MYQLPAPATGPARVRAFKRAAIAWSQSRPHTAWEILAVAGLSDAWPEFMRQALRHHRARFRARMR